MCCHSPTHVQQHKPHTEWPDHHPGPPVQVSMHRRRAIHCPRNDQPRMQMHRCHMVCQGQHRHRESQQDRSCMSEPSLVRSSRCCSCHMQCSNQHHRHTHQQHMVCTHWHRHQHGDQKSRHRTMSMHHCPSQQIKQRKSCSSSIQHQSTHRHHTQCTQSMRSCRHQPDQMHTPDIQQHQSKSTRQDHTSHMT